MRVKVLIVEDDVFVSTDLKLMVESFGHKVTGVANTALKAFDFFMRDIPDLILCDINLRTAKSGIDFVVRSRKVRTVPVIYITAFTDEKTLAKALNTAPESYLTKPFSKTQLEVTINMALKKHHLKNGSHRPATPGLDVPTEREKEIIRFIKEGLSSREIAEKLFISFETVQTHRKNILVKFNVKSSSELIAIAMKNRWIK